MRTSLRCPDAVDEGHAELLVRRAIGHRDVPPLIWRLVDYGIAAERLRILGEVLTLDRCAVPADLDLLAQSHRQIVDTAFDQVLHVLCDARHSESRKVWPPPDVDMRLVLALLDGWLLNLRHVLLEDL